MSADKVAERHQESVPQDMGAPPLRRRRICFAVDDFGLHDGVNAAALTLVSMARVHAVGCMVGAPKWAAWHGQARALPPAEVDVGLHLDLTEFPLLKTLRQPLAHWILASYARRLDRRLLRLEIRAQLDAFESAMDRPPAYVDGHQHVHQLPGVRDELMEEMAARYGTQGTRLPWLRATKGAGGVNPAAHGGWSGWVKSHVISALGASGLAVAARRQGIAQNRALLGVYGFDADRGGYLALLSAALRDGADAALVMCHPSLHPDGPDGIETARLVEFDVLHSSAFGQVLRDGGFDLQPMSRILASLPQRGVGGAPKLSR